MYYNNQSNEGSNNQQQVSKYNSGVAIQIRLNGLWVDSHNHSRSGLFKKWNADLDCIWVELAGDVKYKEKTNVSKEVIERDSEYNKYKKQFDDFDRKLLETGQFQDNQDDSFEPLTKEFISKRNQQYKILIEKSLFLKRLEKYLGKGSKWDDEDEDDF